MPTTPAQAPASNTQKPEPPKNATGPAPTAQTQPAPAANTQKPEPPKSSSGPAPAPSTTTKPSEPAKTTADTKAPPKKVDYTVYDKKAKEDAKRDFKEARKNFDNNGDGKITFNEVLLAYAVDKGVYVDQIPKKTKAELRQQFDELDYDGNGYITEDEVIAMYVAAYEYLADQGIPLQ